MHFKKWLILSLVAGSLSAQAYYEYPLGLDIMYPGIIVSFAMCLINSIDK